MKKLIIAVLVFAPTMLLSSCYVTTTSPGYNYVGYSPGWHHRYHYANYGWGAGGYHGHGWGFHGYHGGFNGTGHRGHHGWR